MIQATEELAESVGVSDACRVLGIPRSSLYRTRGPKLPPAPRPTPKQALSQEEKVTIHQVLNSERFWDIEHAKRVLGYRPQDDGSERFPPENDVDHGGSS